LEEKILKAIYTGLERGENSALASVTSIDGSSPGKTGAIMGVWPDGSIVGTVGGGNLEFEVTQKALECIETNKSCEYEFDLNHSSDLKMICGGKAKVFIKVFIANPHLIIVGGGHIGLELYKLADFLGFNAIVIDDRKEFANKERFPKAYELYVGDVGEILENYENVKQSYVVIATRGHAHDESALRAVVNRDFKYVGMIGSRSKVQETFEKLLADHYTKESLESIYSPVGISISNGEPSEIAFGIMCEILMVKNNAVLSHMRDIKKVEL